MAAAGRRAGGRFCKETSWRAKAAISAPELPQSGSRAILAIYGKIVGLTAILVNSSSGSPAIRDQIDGDGYGWTIPVGVSPFRKGSMTE
jgi:hypothetical protein